MLIRPESPAGSTKTQTVPFQLSWCGALAVGRLAGLAAPTARRESKRASSTPEAPLLPPVFHNPLEIVPLPPHLRSCHSYRAVQCSCAADLVLMLLFAVLTYSPWDNVVCPVMLLVHRSAPSPFALMLLSASCLDLQFPCPAALSFPDPILGRSVACRLTEPTLVISICLLSSSRYILM